jgi:hypothetical protein
MKPKEKALELFEAMRTPIAESDLHIPKWISSTPQHDYPIEERQVAKHCALIAVNEILNNDGFTQFDEFLTEFWKEVKQEIEKL